MYVTHLIAIIKSNIATKPIAYNKIYQGNSEDVIYEFLNDINDNLTLNIDEKEIGKIFVDLTTKSHFIIKNVKGHPLYINYEVFEL